MARILPLLLSLSGCAALSPGTQTLTASETPVIQAGITLAVATAVGRGPLTHEKAVQIKAIALAVYAASSAPAVTVSALQAVVTSEVEKVTNPDDRAAFLLLAQTLEGLLTTYIQSNPRGAVTTETMVSIQGLTQAVILATAFYGA